MRSGLSKSFLGKGASTYTTIGTVISKLRAMTVSSSHTKVVIIISIKMIRTGWDTSFILRTAIGENWKFWASPHTFFSHIISIEVGWAFQ